MLKIQSRSHPYSVAVSSSLQEILKNSTARGPMAYLVDKTVLGLYSADFAVLPDFKKILPIEATETQKSYEMLTPIISWLLESGFRRDWTLMVVGGGVLQDIGCFIASTLFRGARWELVPTTLLAQGDSCIGSKSSINIGPYKNQLGTFYPPHQIHMTFDVLNTLAGDEIRSGIGEIIKLALIAGDSHFEKVKDQLARFKTDKGLIREMVMDSLTIKKRYIEEDELDRGIRNLLNYGHTFGHGYESATHYGIPHGIAVTLGVLTATHFSEQLGYVPTGYTFELQKTLRDFYRPYEKILLETDPEKIFAAMKLDKKNAGGKIHCILTKGAGAMEKVPLGLDEQVRPMMKRFFQQLSDESKI